MPLAAAGGADAGAEAVLGAAGAACAAAEAVGDLGTNSAAAGLRNENTLLPELGASTGGGLASDACSHQVNVS